MTPPTQDQMNKDFQEVWKQIDLQVEKSIQELESDDAEVIKYFADSMKEMMTKVILPNLEKIYNIGYQKSQEEIIKSIDERILYIKAITNEQLSNTFSEIRFEELKELKDKLLNNPQTNPESLPITSETLTAKGVISKDKTADDLDGDCFADNRQETKSDTRIPASGGGLILPNDLVSGDFQDKQITELMDKLDIEFDLAPTQHAVITEEIYKIKELGRKEAIKEETQFLLKNGHCKIKCFDSCPYCNRVIELRERKYE